MCVSLVRDWELLEKGSWISTSVVIVESFEGEYRRGHGSRNDVAIGWRRYNSKRRHSFRFTIRGEHGTVESFWRNQKKIRGHNSERGGKDRKREWPFESWTQMFSSSAIRTDSVRSKLQASLPALNMYIPEIG